ncbi:MAG: periplasmic heavy metal sensor [bacterium]
MKHHTITLFLTSLCIGTMHAQQPPPNGPIGSDQRPPAGDKMSRAFFPPELVMRNQTSIGLTADQRSAIREEMRQTMPRFTELQWQLGAEEEALDALVRADRQDEKQILGQFDKLLQVESELKRVQLGMFVRIKSILTPEQQDKLRELKKQGRPAETERRTPPRGQEP